MLSEIRKNPLMLTDAYNFSHQYLKINTDFEVSHVYNRTAPMILFGFEELVRTYMSIRITEDMIIEAAAKCHNLHVPFPKEIFYDVIHKCDGYFPLKIESVKEGTWVPTGTPFAQIKNTLKGFGEMLAA